MTVLDQRVMRDEKILQLKQGRTVYAESPELIRLIKRGIEREGLTIEIEKTNGGWWFIPSDEGSVE